LHELSFSSFCFSCFLDLHTLGILTQLQSNGIAVPEASMYPVKSPSDVIKLMDIGLKNRAIGATAMNERSSRSHRLDHFFLSLTSNIEMKTFYYD
jgi:kinesin family protein C2/C3